MVSKLLKRLAKRLPSTTNGLGLGLGGGPLADQRAGLESSSSSSSSRDETRPVWSPLPSAWVRMYVWRRDGGRCVRCGTQERVWFDHVVPVWEGGSLAEQNIRLLCEHCRRDKRASRRRMRWGA